MSRRRNPRPPVIEVITASRDGRGPRTMHVFHEATCVIRDRFTVIDHNRGRAVFATATIDEVRQQNDG